MRGAAYLKFTLFYIVVIMYNETYNNKFYAEFL